MLDNKNQNQKVFAAYLLMEGRTFPLDSSVGFLYGNIVGRSVDVSLDEALAICEELNFYEESGSLVKKSLRGLRYIPVAFVDGIWVQVNEGGLPFRLIPSGKAEFFADGKWSV